MKDIFGNFLRITPRFRGKWRLERFWERNQNQGELRLALLPDGSTVEADMGLQYERMVWLQNEEWHELQYLQHRLRKNDTFVDVGANVGIWTLVAASTVGAGGRVFSFEPNPTTYRKLVANIARNEQTGVVTACQQAVTRTNGSVSFACAPSHNLSAISGDPKADNTVTVQAVSLDSVLQGAGVAGMKLDTEGHEFPSLEGAARTIETSSPWLIIEFNTTLLPSPVLADWAVYRFLAARGYKPFTYHGPYTTTAITDSFTLRGYCNILFERNA